MIREYHHAVWKRWLAPVHGGQPVRTSLPTCQLRVGQLLLVQTTLFSVTTMSRPQVPQPFLTV